MDNEEKLLEKSGATEIEYDTLINNYFIRFTLNGKRYTTEHILNVYGASVDFWYLITKEDGKSKYKEFNTLEAIIEFIGGKEQ